MFVLNVEKYLILLYEFKLKKNVMKRTTCLQAIIFILILSIISCGKKIIEGDIISIPVSLSLKEVQGGKIDKLKFTGDSVTVKLNSGKILEVYATSKQMEEAFKGKTKVIIEREENDKWKIVNFVEKKGK